MKLVVDTSVHHIIPVLNPQKGLITKNNDYASNFFKEKKLKTEFEIKRFTDNTKNTQYYSIQFSKKGVVKINLIFDKTENYDFESIDSLYNAILMKHLELKNIDEHEFNSKVIKKIDFTLNDEN